MTKLVNWFRRERLWHMALVSGVATLACFALCAPCVLAETNSESSERWTRAERSPFVGIVKETCKSVVSIQGEKQYEVGKRSPNGRDAQYDVFNGMGTGVVVDERGYILTNYHVVKGLLKLEVVTSDGVRYRDVELIRNDVATDLAILKIKPREPLQKIKMGRAERVELAEDVFAIGNPYGYHCSITRGIVSALDRPLEVNETLSYEKVIQTDAAINPGNSGGPLINVDGEMIGLNAAVREEAENIAFAIPIDVVSSVADRMIRQTVAKMTHHGLKFHVVDSDEEGYPVNGDGRPCLIVDSVDAKSPAASAGVQVGDVLVSSNGYETRSALDFTCSLIGLGLNDTVDLEFERDGDVLSTSLAFSGISTSTPVLANVSAKKKNDVVKARGGAKKGVDATKQEDASESEVESVVATEDELYVDAPVATAFAQEASEQDESVESSESQKSSSKSTRSRSKATQCVWDVFGLEVRTTSSREYHDRFPNLQAVAIGEFNFAPNGGVEVKRVDPNGLLSSGDVGLQEGDLIFGFGVGSDKDSQLSLTSVENLYYIAQRVDEFTQVDSGKARFYLIRSGKPYFLEIDLNQVAQ